MKTVKILLPVLLILLLIAPHSNAQFMKKLGDKLERKVNQRLERKVDRTMDKALDKTEDSIDNSTKKKKEKPSSTAEESDAPASQNTEDLQLETVAASGTYDFDWKYTLQMTSKDGDMKMIYYLKPNAKYFGFKPDTEQTQAMGTGNMFTVMDEGTNKMMMFMDMNGTKMLTAMKMPKNMVEKAAEKQEEFTMTELGTKTIMGYHCQGIRMENDEYVIVSYYTTDAPVSFTSVYGSDPKNMPKGFNPNFLKNADKALMMEMNMTHKKKSKRNMKMTCIELKKEPFSINASEYKSFGGGFNRKN